MDLYIFIASGWGPVYGGINSFNYDLAIACARRANKLGDAKICCIVPDIKDAEKNEMETEGIIPISISKSAFESKEASIIIAELLKDEDKLKQVYPNKCHIFCIGHDVHTGCLSRDLTEKLQGFNVVFHHMDYSSYYMYFLDKADQYSNKTELQKGVICDADIVFGVGPKLTRSAKGITRSADDVQVFELRPGLQEIKEIETVDERFRPVIFGRVEEGNQLIKQTCLGIDAFANAVKKDNDDNTQIIKEDACLSIIGYDNSASIIEETRALASRACDRTGGLCGLVPYYYINNRAALANRISEASLVMMLSYHEGFGLVGYEAIAAGVPLILSENSGLYEFLKEKHLEKYVIPVKIKGAATEDGYSEKDLENVTNAILDMRKHEDEYKQKALKLRNFLHDSEFSWDATAKSFMTTVSNEFNKRISRESVNFISLEQFKDRYNVFLNDKNPNHDHIISRDKHVYLVEGENAFMRLCAFLEKRNITKYPDVFIYKICCEDGESVFCDFLQDCYYAFGKGGDGEGSTFINTLGERLNKKILIIDGFKADYLKEFSKLFDKLNHSGYAFFVYAVNDTESPYTVNKYSSDITYTSGLIPVNKKELPDDLTEKQKIIASIISVIGNHEFSKRLINYIGRGVDYKLSLANKEPLFNDIIEIESSLVEKGLIEEYSSYSYQISSVFVQSALNLDVPNEIRALGLSIVGDFYSHRYDLSKYREPNFRLGCVSCMFYKEATQLDSTIKEECCIKYENTLMNMRKEAMNASKYSRYYAMIDDYLKIYEKPKNPWLWYNLLHCASIIQPSPDTLEKAYEVIKTINSGYYNDCDIDLADLSLHIYRIITELEYETGDQNLLDKIQKRFLAVPEVCKGSVSWVQFLSSIIMITCDKGEVKLAEFYLSEYQKYNDSNNRYFKAILAPLKTSIEIVKYKDSKKISDETVTSIKQAYNKAKNELRDYRLQGWTIGLWGECLLLSGDSYKGNNKIRKSLYIRRSSEESNLFYKNWLNRILTYKLETKTEGYVRGELKRIEK